MKHLDRFIQLMQDINPEHTFTGEQIEFLEENFVDLRALVESWSEGPHVSRTLNFEDVLPEEIFYSDGSPYVKLNPGQGRELKGTAKENFLPLQAVQIYVRKKRKNKAT